MSASGLPTSGGTDWRLAVDIGGTFTDVVLLDAATGRVAVGKTLTTPAAPLDGVRTGVAEVLAEAGVRPGEITAPIVHATTLITNALIEGKTGRAALVTTQGFGDTLLIRDEHRYDMYDLQIEFPAPPVPRDRTFELDERTMADGRAVVTPSEPAMDELAAQVSAAGAEAIAVCLLNSYVNPTNERVVADHLQRRLGVPVCISAEVSPQIREYPRMITTACNAATMPVIGPYLDELQKWLAAEGFGGSVLMMLSNGGVVSAADAARVPIRLVESGPAAGALAGSWFARKLGERRLLCFDMGGTTAKSCLVKDFEPELTTTFEVARMYRFKKGSGFPVSVPSVDLVEIGAGGGSLARIDELGLLKVGPESSGAEPGPACYGRGGTQPAVTDADVLLGLLDPDFFLGGDMPLDVTAATVALEPIAAALGLAVDDTAAGVHDVVNQNMAASSRMHAVEQGVDLRGVAVIAFGARGRSTPAGWPSCWTPTASSSPSTPACSRRSGRWSPPCASIWPARWCAGWRVSTRPNGTPCSTSCGPRAGGSWRRPASLATPCGSVTGSMPATSARATRSRSGSVRANAGPPRPTRWRGGSTRSTSASTA